MLKGARGRSVRTIEELNPVVRGWAAYFKLTETQRALEERDGWLRRKLRCILWRQWKRPYTRAGNLMKAGLQEERALRSVPGIDQIGAAMLLVEISTDMRQFGSAERRAPGVLGRYLPWQP